MHHLISIQEFKEGLELAKPIKNKFGQILIAEGVRLEGHHKTILLTWGITEIFVKESEEIEIIHNEAEILEVENKLKARLNWKARNQYEDEIIELALAESLKR